MRLSVSGSRSSTATPDASCTPASTTLESATRLLFQACSRWCDGAPPRVELPYEMRREVTRWSHSDELSSRPRKKCGATIGKRHYLPLDWADFNVGGP